MPVSRRPTYVVVTDTLPDDLVPTGVQSSQGTCTIVGTERRCELGDVLPRLFGGLPRDRRAGHRHRRGLTVLLSGSIITNVALRSRRATPDPGPTPEHRVSDHTGGDGAGRSLDHQGRRTTRTVAAGVPRRRTPWSSTNAGPSPAAVERRRDRPPPARARASTPSADRPEAAFRLRPSLTCDVGTLDAGSSVALRHSPPTSSHPGWTPRADHQHRVGLVRQRGPVTTPTTPPTRLPIDVPSEQRT